MFEKKLSQKNDYSQKEIYQWRTSFPMPKMQVVSVDPEGFFFWKFQPEYTANIVHYILLGQ